MISSCLSPACSLKNLFISITIALKSKIPLTNIQDFFDIFFRHYTEDIIIESIVDALQVLLHSFTNKECMKDSSKILETFQVKLTECYKCRCHDDLMNTVSEGFPYITVNIDQIEDLTESSFVKIFSKRLLSSSYNICKKKPCRYKRSTKTYFFESSPEYIIFNIN